MTRVVSRPGPYAGITLFLLSFVLLILFVLLRD
jgi:hypothetical protein